MSIWLNLLIPLIAAGILLALFSKKLTWWEVLIPTVACLLFIVIFKAIVEKIETSDTEYHGSLIVSAKYYEPYTTWIVEECSRQVACGTDSKGNTIYRTEYYDCSHCDEHGPEWIMTNSLGETWNIDFAQYEYLRKRWSTKPEFIELNRDINYHGGCGQDGDAYEIRWNKLPMSAESTTTEHTYKNRIKAAHTAFDYPEISDKDKKQYKLFDYPKVDGYSQKMVLGLDSIKWVDKRDKWYMNQWATFLNGQLGVKKHARIYFLYFKDMPAVTGNMQEAYWDGGNDNEIVICIGLSSKTRDIQWVKPFTWSPIRRVIPDVRDGIANTKSFEPTKISKAVWYYIDKEFKRRHFEEFDYVSVDPPTWAKWVTFFVTLAITIGVCYWSVTNDIDGDNDPMGGNYRPNKRYYY
jgi:hypothetical protein